MQHGESSCGSKQPTGQADGSLHYVDFSIKPVVDEAGRVILLIPEGRDITGQKLVESALRESEEKYRALTENTPDILFSTDMDGIITYASPQVNKYGYLEDEVIGKSLHILVHPADIRQLESKISAELEKGAQFVFRFRIVDKWGNTYWCEEKSFLRLDLSGKPIGIYGILRDVTEGKLIEDAIEIANKKLNLMNQITRHDILNTITGLLGCVDMAKATTSPEQKEPAAHRDKGADPGDPAPYRVHPGIPGSRRQQGPVAECQ